MRPPGIQYFPNILSSLRLLLALLFPFIDQQLWLWFIIGSGCSDALDGWIARHWQVQSQAGAILDGVADKLFILSALLTVAASGAFALSWLPLLLVRDLLVAVTALYAVMIGDWHSFHRMDVRWAGKLATVGQFLLLMVAVLFPTGLWLVLWPVILISVIAAADYGRLFVQELVKRRTIDN